MTESLIKPIKLDKESNELIRKAFSKENKKRVMDFEKNVRPKLKRAKDYKPKLSVESIMKAVNDKN